jgi:hypothetical protein
MRRDPYSLLYLGAVPSSGLPVPLVARVDDCGKFGEGLRQVTP